MKNQIPLIIVAVFAIAILLGQVYVDNANAITFTTKSFGATIPASNQYNNCEYLSTTQVWCPTGTGVKVWNPTSQSVTTTLDSTDSLNDIKCGSTYCYTWDVIATDSANLTKYQISGFVKLNETNFTGNTGFQVGHGIGLVTVSDGQVASDTLLISNEGQLCLGNVDEKGVCFWSGATWTALRFISSGSTNDLERIRDIEWNGETTTIGSPTANRAIVKYTNLAGTNLWQLINLADGDTTFATTRICETGSLTGTITQSKIAIIDGLLYDTYSASDMIVLDTTLNTCAVAIKTNLVDEAVIRTTTYDSIDDLFIISATNVDGGTEESAIYIFNGTTFGAVTTTWEKILKINTTSTTNPIWTHFNHQAEGEVQVWIGSNILIIGEVLEPTGAESETVTLCYIVEGSGQQFCKTYDVDENGNIIIPSTIGGVNPRNITDTSNDLFCSLGITDCDNTDIQTNGTGLIMLLILVLVSYALVVYIHHVAKQSVMGIHPMLVLLIGIIDISIAFFLGWIPDFIFYSTFVVLIGLGGFGLYKIIRGM